MNAALLENRTIAREYSTTLRGGARLCRALSRAQRGEPCEHLSIGVLMLAWLAPPASANRAQRSFAPPPRGALRRGTRTSVRFNVGPSRTLKKSFRPLWLKLR